MHTITENVANGPSHKLAKHGIWKPEQHPLPQPRSATNDLWTKDRIYALFPALLERSSWTGCLLSGGEQVLVIGRALMTNPKLLIVDETLTASRR